MSVTMEERNDLLMMMTTKKEEKRVVVAVDESEESMYALSWCFTNLFSADQNQSFDNNNNSPITLILLYIKPPVPVSSALDVTGHLFVGDLIANMEKHSKELANSVMSRADAICRSFNTRVKVEKKIGSGDAKDVICGAVDKLSADVLVMGSHDYGFIKRALFGSVSTYCAEHVKCPVVVVRRPNKA